MLKLKLGAKGELVIPKKIRDQLGFSKEVVLEVKDKTAIIRPLAEDIVKKCEERARRWNIDVSKLTHGDKLYEQVFGEKWDAKLRREGYNKLFGIKRIKL